MKISKIASTALILSTLTLVAPTQARAGMGEGEIIALTLASILGGSLIITTTGYMAGAERWDAQKMQQFLDQAYAGGGEQLETLALASGKSVEETADIIVDLDKKGLLSIEQPEALVKTVAAELAK